MREEKKDSLRYRRAHHQEREREGGEREEKERREQERGKERDRERERQRQRQTEETGKQNVLAKKKLYKVPLENCAYGTTLLEMVFGLKQHHRVSAGPFFLLFFFDISSAAHQTDLSQSDGNACTEHWL